MAKAVYKSDNTYTRSAGSGVIPAGTAPMRRGEWDLYETTNPSIGHFERCFWLEYRNDFPTADVTNATLKNLAKFFEGNIKHNLIFLEFSNMRVMGGVSINAGTSYLRDVDRKKRNAKRGIVDKFPDVPLTQGYELRFDTEDAVTFLTLWPGYSR